MQEIATLRQRQRDRETERQRDRDRDKDIETDMQIDTVIDTETDTEIDTETNTKKCSGSSKNVACRAKERARAYTESKKRAHRSTFDSAKALCEKREGACVWSDGLLLLILGPLRKKKHLQSTGARTQTTLRPVSRGGGKGGWEK